MRHCACGRSIRPTGTLGPEHEWQCTSFATRHVPVRARLGPPSGRGGMEDTPDSDSGGLTPVRVRASPPAPGAPLAQLVERWTLNPCRRGFEPLEAHPTGIIRSFAPGCSSFWTEHPVRNRGVSGSSPFNQTSGEFTPHHSGVVQWHGHSALNRETVVRIHLPEHRRGPVNASDAAVAQSGERRLVTAEATGSKPVCGAKPWW